MLKRFLKALFAFVILPILLLSGVECALRLFHYGHSKQPFHSVMINGSAFHVLNVEYYRQFMPSLPQESDVAPYEVVIPDVKAPGTYRVFVLGSSAAHGWVFPDQGVSRILEAMLRERFPNARFEVFDLSFIAMNSHVMRYIAAQTERLHPDLYVVYMGNNEVKGTIGMIHRFSMKPLFPMHWLMRGFVFVSDLRLVQTTLNLVSSFSGRSLEPEPWQKPTDIASMDDPRLASINRNFRLNLDGICDIARKAGAGVALCTLQRNLRDYPPDVSTRRPGRSLETMQRWEAAYAEGRQLEQAGDLPLAVAAYKRAAALDADFAELQFRLGTCLYATGEYEQAHAAFVAAQENNYALLSANGHINQCIEACARERARDGVMLVDSASALTARSPHGTPGRELFFDHVHFTYEGSYELAVAIFRELAPRLPDWAVAGGARNAEPPTLQSCMERTAYSAVEALHQHEFVVNYLRANVPNADIRYFEDIRNRLQGEVGNHSAELNLAAYERAVQRHPQSIAARAGLCRAYIGSGRAAQTEQAARVFIEQYPYLWQPHWFLSLALRHLNRKDEALAEAMFLRRNYPEFPESWYHLGEVLAVMDRHDEALDAYTRAAAMRPRSYLFHGARGRMLDKVGKLAEAEAAYGAALAVLPSTLTCQWLDDVLRKGDAAHRLETWRDCSRRHAGAGCVWQFLGRASVAAGDAAGAEAAFAKAAELDPSLAGTGVGEELLAEGVEALQANDFARAVAVLEKAVTASSGGIDAYVKLALAYDGANQPEQALAASRKALAQKPMPQEPYEVYDRLLKRHQPGNRVAVWREFVQQMPDAPFALFYLAQASTETGDFAGAVAAYRQAMAVDKTAVWMSAAAATLMMRLNDTAGAVDVLRNALAANPDLQGPRPLLLDALLATGQTAEAEAVAAEIRRRNEPAPDSLSEAARNLLKSTPPGQ